MFFKTWSISSDSTNICLQLSKICCARGSVNASTIRQVRSCSIFSLSLRSFSLSACFWASRTGTAFTGTATLVKDLSCFMLTDVLGPCSVLQRVLLIKLVPLPILSGVLALPAITWPKVSSFLSTGHGDILKKGRH